MNSISLNASAFPGATLKDRAKLVLGSMIFREQTRRWHGFVAQHAVLRELVPHYPRILHKIYRPYVSRHLDCAARVELLIEHYTTALAARLGPLIRRAALSPVQLAAFHGKSGAPFQLRLSAINVAHREGEMGLHLYLAGRSIYSVGFTLHEGTMTLGSLQGLRGEDGAALIKQATRELHGRRPRSFMLDAARMLGELLGCTRLVLVSNRNRITINGRRRHRISADYDAMWRELQAAPRDDGNFELPCALPDQPNFSAIASHKRSEARKRHALLADVGEQLAHGLRQR